MAEPVLENKQVKQRAVRRLIIAVVLVLLAVGLLTYLSYYQPAKVITKPVPIATGPEPVQVDAAQALPEPPPTETPLSATQAAPPPPPSVMAQPLPQPELGPQKTPAPETQKTLVTEAVPAKPAAQAVAPLKPAPNGYVVQFGVFSNTQNALHLVEKLKQAGIEAHTETRVQLPAFKSKAEAEAALAKMKQQGIPATIVAR
jgi:DedD protein